MQATLRYLRSGSSKKRNLAARLALLVMLAAGTPALAADTIEELLREDEASSQNDALRVNLECAHGSRMGILLSGRSQEG